MCNLKLLLFALFIVLLTGQFHLSFFAFGAIVGVAWFAVALFQGDSNYFEPMFCCLVIAIGVIALGLSVYICKQHGLTMNALANDYSFPKYIRCLPYISVVFLITGIIGAFYSILVKSE